MNKNEGVIIAGNFLSEREKTNKLNCLSNMKFCVANINDPSFSLGPKALSLVLVIILWATVAAICFVFGDLLGLSKSLHEHYGVQSSGNFKTYSILFPFITYSLLFVLALISYRFVKSEPKTYTEKLINDLNKYKPTNVDAYNSIMEKLNNTHTLDLSEILAFIDNERKAIKSLSVL